MRSQARLSSSEARKGLFRTFAKDERRKNSFFSRTKQTSCSQEQKEKISSSPSSSLIGLISPIRLIGPIRQHQQGSLRAPFLTNSRERHFTGHRSQVTGHSLPSADYQYCNFFGDSAALVLFVVKWLSFSGFRRLGGSGA